MPRQGQADADKPSDVANAAQEPQHGPAQSRQAECSAAMPPVRLRNFTCSSPAASIKLANRRLRRKAADALDEIGVGIAVAGDRLPDQRQDLKAVEIVGGCKPRRHGRGEFEAEEPPARLQHAARLGERALDVGDVAQAEGDRVEVDAAVGKGQRLGIAAQPLDPREDAVVDRAGAADLEHLLIDVADDDVAALLWIEPLQRAAGDVAGAAGDIDQQLARPRREPGDHLVLPPAVDAGAHQIVHQIVAAGDAVEHPAHQRRLFRRGDPAKAEIRFSYRVFALSLACSSGRKIAPCPNFPKSKPSAAAWR